MNGWLRVVGAPILRWQVERNFGSVTGLENIPAEGGFVLVPNHTSYLDHFVLDFLLEAVRDTPTWFLTKRESFTKPLLKAWTLAWHGIPVDRDRPSSATIREVQAVLDRGDALCVYPEGTRNPNPDELLEFKTGAFHFAANANVQIIPVALVGTSDVLPRGQRRFHRGRIDVAFGEPITLDIAVPKAVRIRQAVESSRVWIERALQQLRVSRQVDVIEQNGLGARITMLARGNELHGRKRRAVTFVVRALRRAEPRSAGPTAALARIRGLRALARPRWVSSPLLSASISGLYAALRIDRHNPATHYYLGTALLAIPRRSRERISQARDHLEQAVALGGGTDPRPLIGLTQAHLALNERDDAATTIAAARAALSGTDPHHDQREARIAALEREVATA